ncbi:MAG: DUF3307 domain-containing protein [Saprospiraceae bacterium]
MIPPVLFILFIHWLADFVLQTGHQAITKCNNLTSLLSHTLVYSLCWLVLWPMLGLNTLFFIGITFLAHTFTDFFTSKLNSKYRLEKKERELFISVGFDQFLHYVQLILTYQFCYELA